MWNPPIALTSEEQKIAARTRKTRKFFVFLREHRHELLDADFQHILAQSSSPEPSGQAPVDAGLLALATLLQAYGHVGDRDAVELTVMDQRWQLVLDCLGAEPPPFSQGTLFHFRMRLIAHNLDKTLLERTVALAEKTGGFGARQLRAVLDSTPLFGAGRVEDTLNLLGHALRKAVGLAAQELGTSAPAVVAAAGLTLVGHSSLKAALDLDWGEPRGARPRAGPGPGGGGPVATLAGTATHPGGPGPSYKGGHGDHRPDDHAGYGTRPCRGAGGRRIKQHVAPDRRISIEDKDIRHGRTSSSKTFNGFKEHFAGDLESTVTREVVVRPAHEPEHEVVELLAEALEKAPGLLQLNVDLGSMASPRMAQWAEQGVSILARPWPTHWSAFYQAGFHVGLCEDAGDLSGWPACPDGPRPACPVSGCGV